MEVVDWKLFDKDNLPKKEILVRTKKGEYLVGRFISDSPIFYITGIIGTINKLETIIDYLEHE
jgi:hypothetical protein